MVLLATLLLLSTLQEANSAPVHAQTFRKANSGSLSAPLGDSEVGRLREGYIKAVLEARSIFSNFTCSACEYAVKLLQDMFNSKLSFNAIAEAAGEICSLSGAYTKNVCNGVAQTFKDEVLTVFSMVGLSPEEVCAGYFKQCGSTFDPFNQHWNISVPGNKPPVSPVAAPKSGSPVIRILQLTDIHYDPLYTEGLSNDCGEPLCCRPPNKKGSNKTAAGPWGDYNCDVPGKTIQHLFQHLQSIQDQFDWIYWTGDMTPHNIWNQTRKGTLDQLKHLYDLFDEFLPNKTVFPSFGNHDTVPVNGFPQPFIQGNQSLHWLTDPTAGNWSHWLSKFPNWTTTASTIKRGGFYNVRIHDGLRVIALQTTYCEKQNFWLLINATDPGGQLQWLAQQLLEAERVGDKVHIIGHHPPGLFDSVPSYASNYHRIVNRFESTIVGQFFGHTHADSFKLYFDDSYSRPTNVLFIGPGVTSYQGYNLGYRIYVVDGYHGNSTHAVLDHETYVFDLDKANKDNSPEWTFEYSAKKAYNMSSLQPSAFFQLWKTLKSSKETLQLYNKYFHKSRRGISYNSTYAICDIVKTTYNKPTLCSTTAEEEAKVSTGFQEYASRNSWTML